MSCAFWQEKTLRLIYSQSRRLQTAAAVVGSFDDSAAAEDTAVAEVLVVAVSVVAVAAVEAVAAVAIVADAVDVVAVVVVADAAGAASAKADTVAAAAALSLAPPSGWPCPVPFPQRKERADPS